MLFEFASGQTQGKRAAQEDTVDVLLPSESADKPGELARSGSAGALVVVVADGMGGHVGGRIASNLSSKYFLDAVNKGTGSWADRMDQALVQANETLRTATEKRPELDGMGSTLVGAILNEFGLGWVSIGDSGLYLARGGELTRLNEDHSFGAYLDEQVKQGLLTPEQAAQDRRRNQLFHALLGDPIDHYERFAGFRELAPGDCVLLASDGLKTLTDEQVGQLIADHRNESAETLVTRLLDAVDRENKERQDNTSVILVRVQEGDAPTRTDRPEGRTTTVPLSAVPVDADEPVSTEVDKGEGVSSKVDAAARAPVAAPAGTFAPVTPAAPAASADTKPERAGTVVSLLLGLIVGLVLTFWFLKPDMLRMFMP
ncbi:PP2C family protein-serine/threonine phosphatase [Prosthecomicrobium sp. N25]|uniref:PP2C family protein-serine/threonine phosphatase n=1 Tax=Prosthecomicrobium sp. N25 TaxID=3129254 RepID=UPI0030770491